MKQVNRFAALAAALALAPLPAGADKAAAEIPEAELLAYAQPALLVTLPGGRRINLVCRGEGPTTVILEAGGLSWSIDGRVIVHEIAKEMRVCAYDRAGHGFSDPGPEPRTAKAVADDLHEALTAAHIAAPYVLVGHSKGGEYIRAFRDAHPGDVAGLVFLDPGGPERSALFAQVDPQGQKAGDTWLFDTLRTCIALARDGSLASGVREPALCVDEGEAAWPRRSGKATSPVKLASVTPRPRFPSSPPPAPLSRCDRGPTATYRSSLSPQSKA